MNKLIIVLCLCSHFSSHAQTYTHIFYLDANFSSISQKEATFKGKGFKEEELFKLDCFNLLTDKIFMEVHFTDSTLSTLQGLFRSYYANGKIENEGIYNNSAETGLWQRWDEFGNKIDSTIYVNGRKTNSSSFGYDSSILSYKILADSITKTYQHVIYFTNGKVKIDAQYKDTFGVITKYDSLGNVINKSNVTGVAEVEATYIGGVNAFANFLRKNMNPLVPAENNAPNGTYTVVVKFIVDENGYVSDITPETNLGYGMEKEAIRVISKSGKWTPAIQFGYPVKAYRRQPLTFVIQGQ